MKHGLPTTPSSAQQKLFGGLSPADRATLSSGFGPNVHACWALWNVPAKSELTIRGPQHFPVRSLLNTAGFFDACRRIESEVFNADKSQRWLNEADLLANVFRDYQIRLIRVREADLDSAVTVFARLNRTGRKMAADEMVSALTYQRGQFHLAQNLDDFKAELDKNGFGNLDRVFLLRAVLAALNRDIYAKYWADLMVKPEVRAELPNARSSPRHKESEARCSSWTVLALRPIDCCPIMNCSSCFSTNSSEDARSQRTV